MVESYGHRFAGITIQAVLIHIEEAENTHVNDALYDTFKSYNSMYFMSPLGVTAKNVIPAKRWP
jgi:hypothetical protein